MAPCSHAIFVEEDDPLFLSIPSPPAATAIAAAACGEIELLIHSDACSSSNSVSSKTWEKALPAVEIHVHSEAEQHSRLPRRPSLMDMGFHSEHSSEYFEETLCSQKSSCSQLSPSGVSLSSPEDGLTRLLRTSPMVADFVNNQENGRLRWNDVVDSDPKRVIDLI